MAHTPTRALVFITAATALTYQRPRRTTRRRAAAVEDIDPLAVLGLDAGALAVLDTAARAKEVRRAYRKAALDSHPDTSALDRADRFSLVQRAADLLRQDDVLDRLVAGGAAGARKAQDDKLSRLWRDEAARIRRAFEGACDGEAANTMSTGPDDVPFPMGGPPTHWDSSLRYLPCEHPKHPDCQFYRRHHDTIPELATMQPGPRVYTFFLYLSDVEEGGGTRFTKLGFDVQPRAAA